MMQSKSKAVLQAVCTNNSMRFSVSSFAAGRREDAVLFGPEEDLMQHMSIRITLLHMSRETIGLFRGVGSRDTLAFELAELIVWPCQRIDSRRKFNRPRRPPAGHRGLMHMP